MFRKVLCVTVFMNSYIMGMEPKLHFPEEIVQWLIIPKERYDAVDTYYKSIRNRYIDYYSHKNYSSIINLLDELYQSPRSYKKLTELLGEVDSDDVMNWHHEYETMRNIHLIEVSHYPYALEQLNKFPTKTYKECYFRQYNMFQESTNNVADSR